MTIKIPIEAAFDEGSADQALKDFTKQFNSLGETIAKVNKQKFNPIDKASIDQVKQVTTNFQNLLKIHGDLRKRMTATGQGGAGIFGLNWGAMYPDQGARSRQMRKVFDYVTGAEMFQPMPGGGGGGGGGRSGGGGGGGANHPPAITPPSAGRSFFGRVGMSAAGAAGFGGPASEAAAGMSSGGGMAAGLAGLAGGMVALGVGKLIGMVRDKIGSAQDENIQYDTLKRQLGDVNVSFDALKENLRLASNGLGITYNETVKLAQQFTRTSGAVGGRDLPMEMRNAVGFSRAYGMDPSQGAGFFGQMHMYGTTSGAEDSRRLGAMIGEGVARSGSFAKMDVILQGIGTFVETTARSGMGRANVGGYMQFLTTMMGSGMPGTDPASSIALMSHADSAFRSGGSEPTQNFLYRAIGGPLGLDPFQTMVMREGGLFSSGADRFGKKGVYSQYMKAFGGNDNVGAAGSNVSSLDLLMQSFVKNFGGRPELMANAMSGVLGLNNTQSMSFATSWKKYGATSINGLNKRMSRLGLDITKMDPSAIGNMASIEADGSLSESQKDSKIKDAAVAGQIKTEGQQVRDSIADLDNTLQRKADALLEPLMAIRAAVSYMAGGGKKSPREIMEEMARVESSDRVNQINAQYAPQINAAGQRLGIVRSKLGYMRNTPSSMQTPEEIAKHAKDLSDLEQREKDAQEEVTKLKEAKEQALRGEAGTLKDRIDGIKSGRVGAAKADEYDSLFAKVGREEGVDPRLLKAIAMKESGLDPNATHVNSNGSVDVGIMQHNSRYLKERGIDGNWQDPEANVRAAAKYLKGLGVNNDVHAALRRYNGTGAAAEAYASDVEARYGHVTLSDAAIARERGAAAVAGGHLSGSVTVQVVGADNQPISSQVSTSLAVVRKPAPAGAS